MTIVLNAFSALVACLVLHSSVEARAVDTTSLLVDGDMMMIKTIPASWVMRNARDHDRRRGAYDEKEADEEAHDDDEDEDEWQSIGASNYLPHLAVRDVARALEYTSNLNNRLMQTTATTAPGTDRKSASPRLHSVAAAPARPAVAHGSKPQRTATTTTTRRPNHFRGGASTTVRRRCFAGISRANNTTMRLPLTAPGEIGHCTTRDFPRTIFHAPPSPKASTGTSATKPSSSSIYNNNLSDFLEQALQCIVLPPGDAADSSSRSVVSKNALLALTVLYLDRACAVDTPRYYQLQLPSSSLSSSSCPFCSPATVHRLALTALLVAASANNLSICYHDVSASFGISRHECETMMAWMIAALGDPGIYVTPDQMRSFASVWHKRFPASARPTVHAATI